MIDKKKILPILIVFAIINISLFIGMQFYQDIVVKIKFLMAVNLMLFVVSIINYIRLLRLNLNNPNAVFRSVMVGTMIKMIIFAGAALAYAAQKNAPVGIPTLLISMGLYLIYNWIEVSWSKIKK
jgi:hypothetical protein